MRNSCGSRTFGYQRVAHEVDLVLWQLRAEFRTQFPMLLIGWASKSSACKVIQLVRDTRLLFSPLESRGNNVYIHVSSTNVSTIWHIFSATLGDVSRGDPVYGVCGSLRTKDTDGLSSLCAVALRKIGCLDDRHGLKTWCWFQR